MKVCIFVRYAMVMGMDGGMGMGSGGIRDRGGRV